MAPTDTITIINQYVENHEDKYCATVIRGVFWFAQYNSGLSIGGRSAGNAVTIRIPAGSPESPYVPQNQWNGQNGWTLQEGDYIVKGVVENLTTPSALRDSGKEIVTIAGYTENLRSVSGLGHWKVVCK